MESIWLEIVLIAVGILANGFFAGSEFALVSARISRLAQLRDAGVVGAAVAMRLKEAPDRFLATIQIAITAVGTLASAVGGVAAVEALTPALATVGLGTLAQPAALALVIVAITYVSLVLGELAPKAVALRDPERLATLVAPVIAGLSRLSARLVRLLTGSTNLLLRLVGLSHAETSPFVSEEDVRYLLREGAARGVFEKVEEELVHNVFEFADTTVREIMTPRTRIAGLDLVTPAPDVLARTVETGHSRIPVYDGSLDRIVGVVTLKDVARCVARGEAPALAALIRLPVFVPATGAHQWPPARDAAHPPGTRARRRRVRQRGRARHRGRRRRGDRRRDPGGGGGEPQPRAPLAGWLAAAGRDDADRADRGRARHRPSRLTRLHDGGRVHPDRPQFGAGARHVPRRRGSPLDRPGRGGAAYLANQGGDAVIRRGP
jgi:Mg2+/Co2+ transporter CorB